jgi:DNA-binding NarL/FixJ family response regulator
MIHICLLEAHHLIREALLLFLATQADFAPAAVSDVESLLGSVSPGTLALVPIDGLPGSVRALVPRIKVKAPTAHVVLLSLDENLKLVSWALGEGVEGFIHKRADPVAIFDALRRIANGETVVLGAYDTYGGESIEPSASPPSLLTDREVEVIRLLAQDYTARQVASTLGVSIRTVHAHLQNSYRKLGVHGRIGAILEAVNEGFLPSHYPPTAPGRQ